MRPARLSALTAAACAALLLPAQARAACTITTAGPVAFGPYDPTVAGPDDSTGNITVFCALGDSAVDSIALSTGGSGTYFPRRMTSGPWTLNYNLYTTAARTTVWGNGTGGTATVTPTGTVFLIFRRYQATAFGRIPALQNVGAGTYGDTITVTVTW